MSDLQSALRNILTVAQDSKCAFGGDGTRKTVIGVSFTSEEEARARLQERVFCDYCGGTGLDPLAKLVVERLGRECRHDEAFWCDTVGLVAKCPDCLAEWGPYASLSGPEGLYVPIDLSALPPEAQEWAVYGICVGFILAVDEPRSFWSHWYALLDEPLPPVGQRALAALTAVLKARQGASHA